MDVPLHEDLTGQVALVTGANRGMGNVIAEALRDQGATVFFGTRDLAAVETDKHRIPVAMDVGSEASIQQAAATIADEAGHLDILVNNAGIAPGLGETILDEPTAQLDRVLATNLRGPMLVCKHLVGSMFERPGARVVNMSSGMGSITDGMGGEAPAYRISKAGLNALTMYLHHEFHDEHGLLANAVCPGWVRTELGGPAADRSPEEGAATPIWLCRFRPEAPSGRFWRDQEPIAW